ncbi:hypothetical protein [Defluviitalea raffinosedens]|jgi:hypothetical protein|uniref:hypothetical protein n=1 Tax=Defluviitalea raffinosedens TaxID=1450156 RepID=UPI00195D1FC5|nr:hypothetical protein [Defluviitalea raffinosedens]MBM7686935.1 hypothetical protein [Defluviitalea raffinosedens]MBZ4669170.1 hypothetical protein [Defluviitaleaceae bacterium]
MFTCPKCNGNQFVINREATFLYSYKLDPNDEDMEKAEARLNEYPYLFYNRELLDSQDYILCMTCNTKYPFSFSSDPTESKITILRKAIRSDHTENPQFLG